MIILFKQMPHCPTKMVRQFRCSAFIALLLCAEEPHPLIGTWDGQWDYTEAAHNYVHKFRLSFQKVTRHRVIGNYIDLQSPSAPHKIDKIVRTGGNSLRMDAGGYCWNFTLQKNTLAGNISAGECTPFGSGSGTSPLWQFRASRK